MTSVCLCRAYLYTSISMYTTSVARFSAFLITFCLIATSCGLQNQVAQLANLAKCEYRLGKLSDIQLAGVTLDNYTNTSQLNLTDAARIATAYLGGTLPMNMTLHLDVKNPNTGSAAMNKVDYILGLEGQEITHGVIANGFSVAANSTGTLPIGISVDLKKVMVGKSKEGIINLLLNLAGQKAKPSNVNLQIKPSFTIAGQALEYPNYFTVNTTFQGGKL